MLQELTKRLKIDAAVSPEWSNNGNTCACELFLLLMMITYLVWKDNEPID